MEQYLGRIGTFIRVFFSTTSLCQSPYLTQLKVGGYEDYSIDWFNACNAFKLNQRSNQESLAALIEGAANPMNDDEAIERTWARNTEEWKRSFFHKKNCLNIY